MVIFRRRGTQSPSRSLVADPGGIHDALADELATVQAVHALEDEGTVLALGTPSRCPNCGAMGYVEGVNGLKGTCFNQCLTCRNSWVITERALRTYERMLDDAARLRRLEEDGPDTHPDGPGAQSNPWIEKARTGEFVRVQEGLEVEITEANASLAERERRRTPAGGGEPPSIHFV